MNDFISKDYEIILKEPLSETDKNKCSRIKNLVESILKNYNLFQQKEMNFKDFHIKCVNIFEPVDQEAQNLISLLMTSMDGYKKNKSKYIDEIKKENE